MRVCHSSISGVPCIFSDFLIRLDRSLYHCQGRAELRIVSWKRAWQSVWIAAIRGLHLDALKAGYAAGSQWDWTQEPMPHKPSFWAFRWTKGFRDAIWYRGAMGGGRGILPSSGQPLLNCHLP